MNALDAPAFLKLSPEEQATEMARRIPRFATLPKSEQQEQLAELRTRLTPPKGPELDVPGRLKEAITRGVEAHTGGQVTGRELTAADPRTPTGSATPLRGAAQFATQFLPGSWPEVAAMVAPLPFKGGLLSGPLKRSVAAGLFGGGTAALEGRSDPFTTGAKFAAGQLIGEAPISAIRAPLYARRAKPLLEAREAGTAFDKAMHEAITGAEAAGYQSDVAAQRSKEAARIREARAQHQELGRDVKARHTAAEEAQARGHEAAVTSAKATHEQASRTYAEQGATRIADAFKGQVSAWREFPSNERGLLDMVYGKGQQKLSAVYDEVMKEIAAAGRGRSVDIPHKDAQALGIRAWDVRGPKERGMPDMARVDASQLAAKATGYWKTDHGVYRRAVNALDKLDIGNPAARAEYKAGQALIQFTDKTQMLKGEKFNPEAARAGFTKLKTIDELRRRGQGDIFEGPIADAVRRPAPQLTLPTEPTPLTPPRVPAFRRPPALDPVEPPGVRLPPEERPMPEGVRTKTMPHIGFWEAAVPVEAAVQLITGQHGWGAPGAAAGLAGRALSGRTIVTQAPLPPAGEAALRLAPPLGAEWLRSRGLLGLSPETSDDFARWLAQ